MKWKPAGSYFVIKNGGGTHTIEYNERTIPYFFCNFVLYFVAAP